ncbi:MAG: serine hydrolase [Aerococcus sp.]|nr:serine hydrolase [Aerococcus sp.]
MIAVVLWGVLAFLMAVITILFGYFFIEAFLKSKKKRIKHPKLLLLPLGLVTVSLLLIWQTTHAYGRYQIAQEEAAKAAEQAKAEQEKDQFNQQVTQDFEKLFKDQPGQISATILDSTGAAITNINGTTTNQTASLYKPLAAMSAFHLLEQGKIESDEESQIIQDMKPALLQSDNATGVDLADNIVGWDRLADTMHELDFSSFEILDPIYNAPGISSQDMATFFYQLNQGKLVNADHTQQILTLLGQSYEPWPIDQKDLDAYDYTNKYGNLDDVYNDSGILKTPNGKTYYLAFMVNHWQSTSTELSNLYAQIETTLAKHLK